MSFSLNFPIILTLIRLILSPLILPLCLVYLLPFNYLWLNFLLALLFVAFSITDFLDGYIARKYKMETKFGKALDPIADKFLISSTLISLLAIKKIYFLWVIILIGREFFMMGLRQIALENNYSIDVSIYGKIKTTFQIIMLTVIILNPFQEVKDFNFFNALEMSLIAFTIFLSIFSAFQYYLSFRKII